MRSRLCGLTLFAAEKPSGGKNVGDRPLRLAKRRLRAQLDGPPENAEHFSERHTELPLCGRTVRWYGFAGGSRKIDTPFPVCHIQ